MDQLNFEEAKQIFGWREMRTGTYDFVDKEVRGMNKWMKPITVMTLKEHVGAPPIKYYVPPSLHYGLDSRPKKLGSSMKAGLNPHPASNTLSSSMLRDCIAHFQKIKTFQKTHFQKNLFFYLKFTPGFYNG